MRSLAQALPSDDCPLVAVQTHCESFAWRAVALGGGSTRIPSRVVARCSLCGNVLLGVGAHIPARTPATLVALIACAKQNPFILRDHNTHFIQLASFSACAWDSLEVVAFPLRGCAGFGGVGSFRDASHLVGRQPRGLGGPAFAQLGPFQLRLLHHTNSHATSAVSGSQPARRPHLCPPRTF